MSLTQAELDMAPKMRLGGVDYALPTLTVRQLKTVVPKLAQVTKQELSPFSMSEATVNDLFAVIFLSLSRAYPDLTQDQFDNLPISMIEAIQAVFVVMKQTGMIDKDTVLPLGEALAGVISTGTTSSPAL